MNGIAKIKENDTKKGYCQTLNTQKQDTKILDRGLKIIQVLRELTLLDVEIERKMREVISLFLMLRKF